MFWYPGVSTLPDYLLCVFKASVSFCSLLWVILGSCLSSLVCALWNWWYFLLPFGLPASPQLGFVYEVCVWVCNPGQDEQFKWIKWPLMVGSLQGFSLTPACNIITCYLSLCEEIDIWELVKSFCARYFIALEREDTLWSFFSLFGLKFAGQCSSSSMLVWQLLLT